AQLGWIGDQVAPQPAVKRRIAKVRGPVVDLLAIRGALRRGKLQHSRGGVIAVGFELYCRFGAYRRELRRPQRRERQAVALLRDGGGGGLADAMQRNRRVIRPEVAAMTPDAAVGHQAVLQEYRLAFADVVAAEQARALSVHHLRRNRRRIAISQR